MTFKRSTNQTIRLAFAAVLSTFVLSACVQSLDIYDDEYYPAQQTVVVKHPRPVYHRVEVYEQRPTVIVNRPTPYYYEHHYYQQSPAHVSAQIVVRPKPHHHHHEHNTTVVKPYSQRENVNTTVVKEYRPSTTSVETRYPNNYETHEVPTPSRTAVKHPKKIVIQSPDAPPSTLAE